MVRHDNSAVDGIAPANGIRNIREGNMAKKLKAPKNWKVEKIRFKESLHSGLKKMNKRTKKGKFVGFKKGY